MFVVELFIPVDAQKFRVGGPQRRDYLTLTRVILVQASAAQDAHYEDNIDQYKYSGSRGHGHRDRLGKSGLVLQNSRDRFFHL